MLCYILWLKDLLVLNSVWFCFKDCDKCSQYLENRQHKYAVLVITIDSFFFFPFFFSHFIFVCQDFFGKPAFLTVSGQLNAETYATALSDVNL